MDVTERHMWGRKKSGWVKGEWSRIYEVPWVNAVEFSDFSVNSKVISKKVPKLMCNGTFAQKSVSIVRFTMNFWTTAIAWDPLIVVHRKGWKDSGRCWNWPSSHSFSFAHYCYVVSHRSFSFLPCSRPSMTSRRRCCFFLRSDIAPSPRPQL